MTTPATTDDVVLAAEETPAGVALAAGLEAVAGLHDEALDRIAHLADTWAAADAPADEVRVLRLAERPTVGQRVEAAAA
ncbi:hypothetical protein [Modestobacter versicolor]|uniref:Uncharacterized protein n=1 Tax=Modestobacter versicolor TaxID=429133 RepID=A0A323V5G7_9ACTN|nr:hypothetical protein [Modestobacter versicolor]MBB3677176.1 hypothetical protein [Modestobacter versicolor]PZA20117.1 hypothetical protein DMO24_17125 [Modestobacter versicolor]